MGEIIMIFITVLIIIERLLDRVDRHIIQEDRGWSNLYRWSMSLLAHSGDLL